MDTLGAPSQTLSPKAMLLNHPSHPLLILGDPGDWRQPETQGEWAGVLERVWGLQGTL